MSSMPLHRQYPDRVKRRRAQPKPPLVVVDGFIKREGDTGPGIPASPWEIELYEQLVKIVENCGAA